MMQGAQQPLKSAIIPGAVQNAGAGAQGKEGKNGAGGAINNISGGASGMKGGKDASNIMNQGIDWAKNAFNQGVGGLTPYNQAGQGAISDLQKYLQQFKDPTGYINGIMKNWQMSPQAQLQLQQGTKSANQASAASGMSGSGAAQKALMNYGQQVTNADQQQYLNNIMGINQNYAGGLNSLAGIGLNAGGDILNGDISQSGNMERMMSDKGTAKTGEDAGKGNVANGVMNAGKGLASDIGSII